jgi:hypothetical protein
MSGILFLSPDHRSTDPRQSPIKGNQNLVTTKSGFCFFNQIEFFSQDKGFIEFKELEISRSGAFA